MDPQLSKLSKRINTGINHGRRHEWAWISFVGTLAAGSMHLQEIWQIWPWSSSLPALPETPSVLYVFWRTSLDSSHHQSQVDWPMTRVNIGNWPFANVVSHEGSTIIISQLCEEHWGFKRKQLEKSVHFAGTVIFCDRTTLGKRLTTNCLFDGLAIQWQIWIANNEPVNCR